MAVLKAADVKAAMLKGGPANVDAEVTARFAAGDRVAVRNLNPAGHTRAPRYIRGKRGEIARDYGVFVFPDSNAMGHGKAPQHLYSVRFEGEEVWGPPGPPGAEVSHATAREAIYLDLWDSYLEPA
jgi:nitrile hydratase